MKTLHCITCSLICMAALLTACTAENEILVCENVCQIDQECQGEDYDEVVCINECSRTKRVLQDVFLEEYKICVDSPTCDAMDQCTEDLLEKRCEPMDSFESTVNEYCIAEVAACGCLEGNCSAECRSQLIDSYYSCFRESALLKVHACVAQTIDIECDEVMACWYSN